MMSAPHRIRRRLLLGAAALLPLPATAAASAPAAMRAAATSTAAASAAAASTAAAGTAAAGTSATPAAATPAALPATPACGRPTPPQTAGPFYTPATPRRQRLVEPGIRGEPLTLTGRVLTPACAPVAGALLDFWQCDADGHYDHRGFRLRGHQYTGADGRYRLETIVPGTYPGRTPHLHVRVQPPGGRLLTTQLYLDGHPLNARDLLYDARLRMQASGGDLRFDFVLAA